MPKEPTEIPQPSRNANDSRDGAAAAQDRDRAEARKTAEALQSNPGITESRIDSESKPAQEEVKMNKLSDLPMENLPALGERASLDSGAAASTGEKIGAPSPATVPSLSGHQRISYGYLIKNVISFMGLAGMGISGLILLFLVLLDLLNYFGETNPYSGIITYIVMPSLLAGSALVTLLGMLIRWRRTRKHGILSRIVPGRTRVHQALAVILAIFITASWVLASSFGTYKAYQYTETTHFCGKACHEIMEPEYTTYQASPHARVKCVECHIGPGADFFVKAKISGLRQVWSMETNQFKTPIKTPIDNLRPARDTCEHCHWPGKFSGSKERVFVHYARDEENYPVRYNMLIKIGGGNSELGVPSGVHWHVSEDWKVEYLPLDEQRQEIPYVKVTYKDGTVEEFMTENFDRSLLEQHTLRDMDCLDCHTRPAHIFRSPDRTLNDAMFKGIISPTLPSIKDLGMKVLTGEYRTREEALMAIDQAVDDYAKKQKFEKGQDELLQAAREQFKSIYNTYFFPAHGVDYRAFTDNMGHFENKGCERCHDGKHKTPGATKSITNKCDACHTIIGQAFGADDVKSTKYGEVEFEHPDDPVRLDTPCSSCHGRKDSKQDKKKEGAAEK